MHAQSTAQEDRAADVTPPVVPRMPWRVRAVQVLPGYKEEQGSLTMIQVFLVVVAAFVMAVFFYVITIAKLGPGVLNREL